MNRDLQVHAYRLLQDFVRAIGHDDRPALKNRFDVSDAVAEEIQEMLARLPANAAAAPRIAPFESAFSRQTSARPNLDLFEMSEKGRWGCECVLWNGDGPGEQILHVEFFEESSVWQLRYRYIGW